MSLEPSDWSVVIVGRWNPAILTPMWIAQHMFQLSEGEDVSIKVPMDGIERYHVGHNDIVVVPDDRRLTISPIGEHINYESLTRAMAIGAQAMKKLPITPVSAAGFNVSYQTTDPDDETLAALYANDRMDEALVDQGLAVMGRGVLRSFEFDKGRVNTDVTADVTDDGHKKRIRLNFHLESKIRDDLQKWLEVPVDKIKDTVRRVFTAFELPAPGDLA